MCDSDIPFTTAPLSEDLASTKPLYTTESSTHHAPQSDKSVESPESLISTLASTCTSRFNSAIHLLSKEEDKRYEVIFRQFEKKFLNWAAYLGVFAEGNGSLDHRLQRHPQYRDLILLLLDMLNVSINQTIAEPSEPSSDESSDDEIDTRKIEAESIQKSINELDRLAIHIRQSSTSSLDTRIKAFEARKPSEVSSYEIRATLAVNGLYPDAPDSLRRYLSKWMTHRYMKLLYWQSHDKKLRTDSRNNKQRQKKATQLPLQPPPLHTKVSSLPRQLVQDEDPVPPKTSGSKFSGGTSFLSGTRASELGSQFTMPTAEAKMPARERAVASTVLESGAKFPSPPKFEDGEDQKPCPLCRKIFLEDDFVDDKWWRSHVNNDLMPFLCVSSTCMESPSFTSRTAWKGHVGQYHDGVWFKRFKIDSQETLDAPHFMDTCPLCCLPLAELVNLKAINSKAPDSDLSLLKERTASANKVTSKTVRFDVAEPKLLVEDDTEAANKAESMMILDHIADHLQFLALLTPRLSSEKLGDGEKDNFSSDQGLSSGQGIGERSTLADQFAPAEPLETQVLEMGASLDGAPQEEIPADQTWQQVKEIESGEAVDWSVVGSLHPVNEGDSRIEHMQRVRVECDDLLDAALVTAVESRHHRRSFLEMAADSCKSITVEMSMAVERGGEVGALIHIFAQEIPRNSMRDFFRVLLASMDVGKNMMLVDYCTEQVWDFRPYQDTQVPKEDKLASRRWLFALLAMLERPVAILKAIKDGISDLSIPLATTTLTQVFPTWSMEEVSSFMRLQEEAHSPDHNGPDSFEKWPNPEDYTVAWICAVTIERVAAEAFLDEVHGPPASVYQHDNNSYKLGKVGRHMVVIAVLPDGEYGTSSAAGVARDLLHSFPNVRIGLMVGIGGGAPSQKHDIRLGDIVVGTTRGGKSSVLQYDFGKAIQDQPLEMTGFMSQAPPSLRTAVSVLNSRYKINGHTLQEAIEKALAKYPRLRKKYKMPGHKNDRLYQSHIIHQDGSCPEGCGDDESVLIARPQRTDEDDDPTIHYGVIASAYKLMKDATIRDRLARDHDILCFEMDAAGLMNHYPCLIIRGICDYSDTHKNDQWQGYAAMVAAAYAKDLLLQINPSRIESEAKITDVLSEIQRSVEVVLEELKPVPTITHSEHERRILRWLASDDSEFTQSRTFLNAEPGTGKWFLDSQPFQTWLHSDKQSLLCVGRPGAGKTVITSIVVNHLLSEFQQRPDIGIAYMYFDYRGYTQTTATDILSSLLRQLAMTKSPLPKVVQELYTRHGGLPKHPINVQISDALVSVVGDHSKVFIVVDAIDECDASDDTRNLVLNVLFHLQQTATVNIFATSRHNEEIARRFGLIQEVSATDDDIRIYLNKEISLNENSSSLTNELKDEIVKKVIAAADGMFLLASLHINTLLLQPSRFHLKETLQSLHAGHRRLDEVYAQIMHRIETQLPKRKALAMRILSSILHSKEPLTLRKLQDTPPVREKVKELDEAFLLHPRIILSFCAGLVVVDNKSSIVRFVHYTVQDFLEREREQWFLNAETD